MRAVCVMWHCATMSTIDTNSETIAQLMIRGYGEAALREARARVSEMVRDRNKEGAAVWRAVVSKLQRPSQDGANLDPTSFRRIVDIRPRLARQATPPLALAS